MDEGYPELGRYLNATGRPIVYSCSWPAYQIGQNPNYKAIAENCNLWRNWDDIDDSWDSDLSYASFLKARIELMRTLLKDSGSIFVHCDTLSD